MSGGGFLMAHIIIIIIITVTSTFHYSAILFGLSMARKIKF